MARFRTSTSKGNTYLQFVESYRNHKGQPATRVLANLRNITKMSEEQIDRLTTSFIKAAGMQEKYKKMDIEAGKGYHYGTVLPVIAIWHQLGLEQIIDNSVSRQVDIPVSRIALIQTANRFADPKSKLACFRWYYRSVFSQMKDFVRFPNREDEKLHTYYRALDYLCEAKEKIEEELYYRLLGYGMDNSLILYDITSTYFEGMKAEIGKKGYSRDKRGDLEQIVIGLVMSRDGIPIAHHVFEGNRVDKTTVEEVVIDLKKRFGIKKAIFVGDRGMITSRNIEEIKGHGYEYILGLQKRNRKLVDHLLKQVMEQPYESTLEFGYSDLSKELQRKHSKKVRIIACYNAEAAKKVRYRREKNVALFEKLIGEVRKSGSLERVKKSNDKLKAFLYRKHISKFYELHIEKEEGENKNYRLKIVKAAEALEKEEQLDGRYFIQTEVSKDMNKSEIDAAYKSLQKVEHAFRTAKSMLDIRPMFVRRETRIKGHIMIIYFALLIETLLEKKLKELFPEAYNGYKGLVKKAIRDGEEPLSMMTLYEALDDIRLIPLRFKSKDGKQDKTSYIVTKVGMNVKKLFSALGVKNAIHPERLLFSRKKIKGDKKQMLLDLGVEYLV